MKKFIHKILIPLALCMIIPAMGCQPSSDNPPADGSGSSQGLAETSQSAASERDMQSKSLANEGSETAVASSKAVSESSAAPGNFDGEKDISTPCIVNTAYPTSDIVVADNIVTNSDFGADKTGVKDSTAAIQKALRHCEMKGGGTVWMPAGTYRITSSITIPAFVTLRGDWQDPDKGNSYGTIILADINSTYKDDTSGLFYIGGSGGAMGLTVYYPNQDIGNVKPYPFTFYVRGQGDGYMLQSIVDCTVINGYKGIGACVGESNAHEMMTVENFKGTFLACGAEAYNQADVGTWKNVKISNKYWAGAGAGLKAANRSKLDAYTRANTTGLKLGDLEWTEFANVDIEDCSVGIHVVKGKRIEFAGSIYGAYVRNCDYGIKIDSMDTRWGMVLAASSIAGSKHAIQNNTGGQVRATDVKTTGAVSGSVLTDNSSLESVNLSYNVSAPKPRAKLYIVKASDTFGETDESSEIQAVLKKAGNGGGVVYLPAGQYRLDNPIAVPAGVELRGAGSSAQREQSGSSKGTLIYAYYGKTSSESAADTKTALVTLNGKNAGVRCVRFVYPEAVTESGGGTFSPYAYTIRGNGAGVYAVNTAITGGYNGIDFRGCDNHLIKKFVGCCFHDSMHVGGSGGLIEGCLQNGNAITRSGVPQSIMARINEANDLFPQIFNKITRVYTTYIKINAAANQTVLNTFSYGVRSLVKTVNSSGTQLVNIGADNIGAEMLYASGGSLTAVNMMRWNGSSYINQGCRMRLYNRLTINQKSETAAVAEN